MFAVVVSSSIPLCSTGCCGEGLLSSRLASNRPVVMPTTRVDPVLFDAIDNVVENKSETAEWETDEMRSALMDYARHSDKSMDNVVEDRDFSKSSFAKQWNKVEDTEGELRQEQESGSGLFPNPVQEARDGLEDFFERLDENYGFGFNDRALKMLYDRVERDEELPHPAEVRDHLDSLSSGVGNDRELDFIKQEYSTWLEKFLEDHSGVGPPSRTRGYSLNEQQGQSQQQGGGVSVADNPNQPQQQGGQRQSQQQTDPQVQQLQREMSDLKDTVSEMADAVTAAVEDDDDGGGADTVTVTQDGNEFEVPVHVAMANGMLGTDDSGDDKDFMDKLREAKEAGIIPDPDDYQQDDDDTVERLFERMEEYGMIGDDDGQDDEEAIERMGEMMQNVSEQFSKAQENTAQQMAEAIERLEEESDDDNQLTMEDLEQFYEEQEKQDRIDELKEELDKTREELRDEVSKATRRSGSDDPVEVKKKELETEADLERLSTVNETVKELPEHFKEIADALQPLAAQAQQAGGPRSPAFSPQPQQGGQQQGQQRQGRQQGRQSQQASSGQQDQSGGDNPSPGGVSEEEAAELREKFGFEGNSDESADEYPEMQEADQ